MQFTYCKIGPDLFLYSHIKYVTSQQINHLW